MQPHVSPVKKNRGKIEEPKASKQASRQPLHQDAKNIVHVLQKRQLDAVTGNALSLDQG